MKSKLIPGLKKYQGRNPKGYFQELDWPIRLQAYARLKFFCERARRQKPLPRYGRGRSNLLKLVDLVGIEPTTSSMPWKRAPSCATGPL
jgi:hypothetical protein